MFILLRKSETLCFQVANVLYTDQAIRFTLSHQNIWYRFSTFESISKFKTKLNTRTALANNYVKLIRKHFDNNNNNKFYLKLEKELITLLSHPQIAYRLIEAGGAEDILQVQDLYIDGLNNSEDTTIQ